MKVNTNFIEYAGLKKAVKKHIDNTDMSKEHEPKIPNSIFFIGIQKDVRKCITF